MTFYRNYDSIEDIIFKELFEIFDMYKNDENASSRDGAFFNKNYLAHFFNYVYKYKDFFDGIIMCGYGLQFLELITEYVKEKWKGTEDELKLIAFSGALFNYCVYWSNIKYKTDKKILIEKLEATFR